MPNFYLDDIKFPKVVKAVLQSTINYAASVIYNPIYIIDPKAANDRFFISDLTAGNEFAQREGVKNFKKINHPYPFTVFAPSEADLRDNINQRAARLTTYSPNLGRYVASVPSTLEVKMISFFNTADDYYRARTALLHFDNAVLTRLYAFLKFKDFANDISKIMPSAFDINWELSEGSYTFAFKEYIKQEKLYDLVHTAKINFYNFILSDQVLFDLEFDEYITELNYFYTQSEEYSTPHSLHDLAITCSIPSTTPISPLENQIIFAFNMTVDELLTERSFRISPVINHTFEWNEDSTILTVNILEPFEELTEYNLAISGQSEINSRVSSFTLQFSTTETPEEVP